MKMKAYELQLTPMPLARFHFDIKSCTLVAEASDLGPGFRIERLYNDACDVGIAIESHHSGAVQRFHLVRTEKRDGDVLAWHFEPVNLRAGSRVRFVTVFND